MQFLFLTRENGNAFGVPLRDVVRVEAGDGRDGAKVVMRNRAATSPLLGLKDEFTEIDVREPLRKVRLKLAALHAKRRSAQ